MLRLLMGHIFWHFHTQHPIHASVNCSGSLTNSPLLTAWSRIYGSQVTNTQTLPDPTFLELYDCNQVTTDSDILSSSCLTSFSWHQGFVMGASCKTIFCLSYMWKHIPMFLTTVKLQFWTRDNDIPTTILCKWMWVHPLVFTSESETITVKKKKVVSWIVMVTI
jgi:hypothetical protein